MFITVMILIDIIMNQSINQINQSMATSNGTGTSLPSVRIVSALATGSLLFITVMILIDLIFNQSINLLTKCTYSERSGPTGSLLFITVMILIDLILNQSINQPPYQVCVE
jgi:hypothetical protein